MLGMKNHFDISGSIEICEVDIAGVACSSILINQTKKIHIICVLCQAKVVWSQLKQFDHDQTNFCHASNQLNWYLWLYLEQTNVLSPMIKE